MKNGLILSSVLGVLHCVLLSLCDNYKQTKQTSKYGKYNKVYPMQKLYRIKRVEYKACKKTSFRG